MSALSLVIRRGPGMPCAGWQRRRVDLVQLGRQLGQQALDSQRRFGVVDLAGGTG